MKRILLLSAILVASSAFATQPGNNGGGNGGCGVGQQTNGCGSTGGAGGQGGAGGSATAGAIGIGVGVGLGGAGGDASAYGGKGGEGGSSAVVGSGNSSVRNENSNHGVNQQSQSASGYGGTSYGGNGAGNSTSVNFEGSTYKEAAQTAYAPTPQGPRTSCRLFVGLGGSARDGSLSGGIPIANDQTCMSGAQIEFMNTVNKIQANTFTVNDYLVAVCAAEGMEKMSACQKKQ